MGETDTAEQHYQQALAVVERDVGPASPLAARLLEQMADFNDRHGQPGKARSLRDRATRVQLKIKSSLLL